MGLLILGDALYIGGYVFEPALVKNELWERYKFKKISNSYIATLIPMFLELRW